MGIWFLLSLSLGDWKWVLKEPRESTTLAWREKERERGWIFFVLDSGFRIMDTYLNGSFWTNKDNRESLYNIPRGYLLSRLVWWIAADCIITPRFKRYNHQLSLA